MKIKLYADETGKQKGDCRVGYENVESVEMALEMLHLAEIRPKCPVTVEQATFQQKGQNYKPREVKKLEKVD